MARRRAQELGQLRVDLAHAMAQYDQACIDLRARPEGAGRAEARRRVRECAAGLRTQAGLLLSMLMEPDRMHAIRRELEAIAPGLAADRRELDHWRRRTR